MALSLGCFALFVMTFQLDRIFEWIGAHISTPPHRPKPLVTGIENLACSCFCKIAALFGKLEQFARMLRLEADKIAPGSMA